MPKDRVGKATKPLVIRSVVSQSKEQKTQQGMESGLLHLISKAEMNPNVLHVVKDKAELFYEIHLDLLFILMQAFKNARSVLQSGHVLKKFRNKNKYIKMKTSSYVAPPFVHLMKLDPFCFAPLNSFPQAHG